MSARGRAPAGWVRQRRVRLLAGVLAVAWAALLFALSSSSDPGGLLSRLPAGSDKVVHAGAYLVLSCLAGIALRSPVLGALLAVVYGASDEIHQSFVPGRYPGVGDLVADTAGALAGAVLVGYLLRRAADTAVQ